MLVVTYRDPWPLVNRIPAPVESQDTGWDTKTRNILFDLFWFEQVPEICSNVPESLINIDQPEMFTVI